jgi:hypothetical protein
MIAAGDHDSHTSPESGNFFKDVPRQVFALTRKNFILAYRNRTATFLRIFASFFFILLIYLVNVGLKARFSADPFFKDYPSPPRTVVPGIPACVLQSGVSACSTFVYAPAPDTSGNGFRPSSDYATPSDFATATGCPPPACSEMFRVHRVVRKIMANNAVTGSPAPVAALPIPAASVLGFANATAMDVYLFNNPTAGLEATPPPPPALLSLSPHLIPVHPHHPETLSQAGTGRHTK